MEDFFRKTNNYRLWVDDLGVGHVRILKRTNLKIIVSIFEEIHSEVNIKFEFILLELNKL